MVKRIKCPHCGTTAHISRWDEDSYHLQVRKGPRAYRCCNCGERFDFKEGALVDGIFLDETETSNKFEERSKKYIDEGCESLRLGKNVKDKTWKLLKKYDEKTDTAVMGRRTRVAGAIYVTLCSIYSRTNSNFSIESRNANNFRTQREVAEEMNTSEVTLRENTNKILNCMFSSGNSSSRPERLKGKTTINYFSKNDITFDTLIEKLEEVE